MILIMIVISCVNRVGLKGQEQDQEQEDFEFETRDNAFGFDS